MKIFANNAVYVQKNDILFLSTINIDLPSEIFTNAFNSNIAIVDEDNRYDFVKFSKKSQVEYFQNMDLILDLFKMIKVDEKDIILLGKQYLDKQKEIINKIIALPRYLREDNELINEYEILDYQINSLGYLLQFIRNNIVINMPTEIFNPPNLENKKKNMFRFLLKKRSH